MVKEKEERKIESLEDCSDVVRDIEAVALESRNKLINNARFGKSTVRTIRRNMREIRAAAKVVMNFMGVIAQVMEKESEGASEKSEDEGENDENK